MLRVVILVISKIKETYKNTSNNQNLSQCHRLNEDNSSLIFQKTPLIKNNIEIYLYFKYKIQYK